MHRIYNLSMLYTRYAIKAAQSTIRAPATPLFLSARKMSSSNITGNKFEWLAIIPDKPGRLEARLEVRKQHLAAVMPAVEAGFWRMGGALLEEVPEEDGSMKFLGSTMIGYAETKEEIMEALKKDIYAKSDVWDLDKVQIYALKTAFRKAVA